MVPFRIIFYLSDSWAQSGIEYFWCGDGDVDADMMTIQPTRRRCDVKHALNETIFIDRLGLFSVKA